VPAQRGLEELRRGQLVMCPSGDCLLGSEPRLWNLHLSARRAKWRRKDAFLGKARHRSGAGLMTKGACNQRLLFGLGPPPSRTRQTGRPSIGRRSGR